MTVNRGLNNTVHIEDVIKKIRKIQHYVVGLQIDVNKHQDMHQSPNMVHYYEGYIDGLNRVERYLENTLASLCGSYRSNAELELQRASETKQMTLTEIFNQDNGGENDE